MHVNSNLLFEPASYNILWTLLGAVCLLLVIIILLAIFLATRKKKIKTIAHLAPKKPVIIDINAIREKYLLEVVRIESEFDARKIKASKAHQELSLVVRKFYTEAYRFRAEFLTLTDLKKSSKKALTATIEKYYPEEFNLLEKGSVADAAESARKLISLGEDKNA